MAYGPGQDQRPTPYKQAPTPERGAYLRRMTDKRMQRVAFSRNPGKEPNYTLTSTRNGKSESMKYNPAKEDFRYGQK